MSDMGLWIAASGLNADTAELNTASNNLSNINTPGYVAERVDLSAYGASGPSGVGQGVEVGSVSRLINQVYQIANISALGAQGAATSTNQIYGSIENIFPEPSSNGLASQLSTLWSNISTLATNPSEAGAQQSVVGSAQAVANNLNQSYSQLMTLQSSLQSQIGSGSNDGGELAQVNSLLSQVAKLNKGIVVGASGGNNVNALLDQSNADVNQLASLMGIRTINEPNGTVSVYMNSIQLVFGDTAQRLVTTGSANTGDLGITTNNGVTVTPSGQIGSQIAAINNTIPEYQQQLNSVADALATQLNSLQASGMAANGDPGSGIAGGYSGTILPNIFVDNGSSTTYTASSSAVASASTIAVSPTLLANNSLLATAAAPSVTNSNVIGTPTLDGTNAQAMAALQVASGGPNELYQTMIGQLGTQASSAKMASATADSLATAAANNISQTSSVNMNTEELQVLAAQNAFSALGHVIDAINTSFQSLIQAV